MNDNEIKILDIDDMPKEEIIARIKNPNQRVATTVGFLFQREAEARANEREKRNTEARLEAIMTETDIRKNERAKIKAELEKPKVLERLAELEHEQWWKMRKSLFEKIEKQHMEITGCSNPYCQSFPDKEGEWDKLKDHIEYRPYAELSEEVKEQDRKWAQKTLTLVLSSLDAEKEE